MQINTVSHMAVVNKQIPAPLDGVDFESYSQIFQAPRKIGGKLNVIKFKVDKNGKPTKEYLNKITKEPYIGCGLVGDDLVQNVLPPLYYNTKVQKSAALVGPSGTGKTSIGECHITNFHNTDYDTVASGDEKKIVDSKIRPILRVQNTTNIQKEEIVGEWNILRMLFADPGANLFTKDFFTVRNMSKALDEGQGRGILLDEVTRAQEEAMNFYLQPTRERKVSTEGQCFGECTPGMERPWFYTISTENEGDAGTNEKPSALQTRFSRIPVDFISASNEEKLVRDLLLEETENQAAIDLIGGTITVAAGGAAEMGIVPCLTASFRGKKVKGGTPRPLTVAPSIGDTRDLSRMFVKMGVTRESYNGKDSDELKDKMARIALTVLGKNPDDARAVQTALEAGICGIRFK